MSKKHPVEFISELMSFVSQVRHQMPPAELIYADEEHRIFWGYLLELIEFVDNNQVESPAVAVGTAVHTVIEDELTCRGTNCDAQDGDGHSDECIAEHEAVTSGKSMRFNKGKPQLSYVMSTGPALDGVARVMEFGAKKYARDNWKKGLEPDAILDSLLRHVAKYLNGEYLDLNEHGEADKDHSGLPHVDHITTNALFLGYHTDRETGDGRMDPEYDLLAMAEQECIKGNCVGECDNCDDHDGYRYE